MIEEGMKIEAAVIGGKISLLVQDASCEGEIDCFQEKDRKVLRGYSSQLSSIGSARSTSNYSTPLGDTAFIGTITG